MGTILGVWLIITLISSFVNTKFFLCSYLAYFLLVPGMSLVYVGLPLGYNAIMTICVVGFLFSNRHKLSSMELKPLIPFIILFLIELLLIPFQDGYSKELMFNSWRVNFMTTILGPFMLWNGYKVNPSILKPLKITFLTCIAIISLYAIYLTSMPGVNPYLMATLPLTGEEFRESFAEAANTGRVFGRISSVFSHPMTFGNFIALSAVLLFMLRDNINKWILWPLLAAVSISLLVCGVRSAIGGLGIGIGTSLILTRQLKTASILALCLICGYVVVLCIPGMEAYIDSIIDTFSHNDSEVAGSSMDMRIDQFKGAFNVIEFCPLQGKGFGWTGWYISINQVHPICLAFESILMVVLCNEGILGLLAWIICLSIAFKKKRYKNHYQWIVVVTIITTYLGYSFITGEYGYMKYMLIFYLFGIMLTQNPQKALKNSKPRNTDIKCKSISTIEAAEHC